jgi:hypothetical protein
VRAISEPVKSYQQTLSSSLLVQPSQQFPNFGPILGIWLDLTVAIAGGTAAATSNTIDNTISHFAIDDQFGKSICDLLGTDLTIINDILTPRGVRQAPPAITTAGGNGSASWFLFLPITVAAADMPGILKLTLNTTASLQNGALLSAGTVTFTLIVRTGYSVGVDQPTLRVKASNPPFQTGDNAVGPYLPQGFQVEALAFTVGSPLADTNYGYLTLFQNGATFASLMPLHDFTSADVMLMQSGHLSGEFICRFPVFVVDSTTVMTINLTGSSAIRLYSIATIPQQSTGR